MQIFKSSKASNDIRLDPGQCSKFHIGSMLAVPIERNNQIAGLIELRWEKAGACDDGDERICQLMAEIMGEGLDSEADQVNAQVPKPVELGFPRFVGPEVVSPSTAQLDQQQTPESSAEVVRDSTTEQPPSTCRVCSKPLIPEDNFCGNCGMLSAAPENGLQSKWASMWFMQQAEKADEAASDRHDYFGPQASAKKDVVNSRSTEGESMISDGKEAHKAGAEPSNDVSTSDHTSPQAKRKPGGVLSVLKLRFKTSAAGRKLSGLVVLALALTGLCSR
jgi:hypothetical protein